MPMVSLIGLEVGKLTIYIICMVIFNVLQKGKEEKKGREGGRERGRGVDEKW